MIYRIPQYLRSFVLASGALLLGGCSSPGSAPSFPSATNEGVPRWALDWSSSSMTPCLRVDLGEPLESTTSSNLIEDSVLAARAEQLAARGFQCAAAEELFQLARRREKTDTSAARDDLARALALALQGDDPRLLARILELSATIESNEQNVRPALELTLAAGFFWRRAGDFEEWSVNQYDLGVLLMWMGRFDESEDLLKNLLSSSDLARGENPSLAAATLTVLGRLHIAKGELAEAENTLEQARAARKRSDSRGLAATLDALCSLRVKQGKLDRAEALNRKVMRLVAGELRSEANALDTAAEIALGLGKPAEALAFLERSRNLINKSGAEDPNLELHNLFIAAGAERALGRQHHAEADMEALLMRFEAYRQAGQGSLAMPFFAVRRYYVSAWIDDLVATGRIAEAFEITEWTRARSLLDGVVSSGAEVSGNAPPSLQERDRELRAELAILGARWEALPPTDERVSEELGSRARRLRLSLMALEAEMRSGAGVLKATPISFDEARQQADDDETLVLCYWLGEKSSLIWVFSAGEAEVVGGLPPRQAIERSARRLRQLLTKGEGADHEARSELQALSDVLLAPVSKRLERARSVVVVPDGALAEVPFAVLPLPQQEGALGEPLIEEVPLTIVHSLSVLAAIRARAASRYRHQTLTFAAVADPVYNTTDSRFRGDPTRSDSHSGGAWRRLRGSGEEAITVARLLPDADTRLFLGVEASRERVLEGCLEGSRFIHFGAHADLHWSDPELSAVYLSMFDAFGNPVDGALRLQDVERLRLTADIVFLAGCKTGLGRDYLGEGPLALPRGFLSAGAASVVATLWEVGDEPTSILVKRFWEGILDDGLSPDLALQRAQIELAHSEWSHPVYWAGFVLLGDSFGSRNHRF